MKAFGIRVDFSLQSWKAAKMNPVEALSMSKIILNRINGLSRGIKIGR
jgi:hypothetical protein